MNQRLNQLISPDGATKYLFFGGKGGVGKTTVATATAVWFADHGFKTAVVSTDPTVSLSAIFGQEIGGNARVPIKHVSNLCGININPKDAKGVYQRRLNNMTSQFADTFGKDMTSTPCMEEMATFDQFVTFLDEPDSDVIVFDTAPTGKTLRELAMPFDWAGFVQKQINEGKELAALLNMDDDALENLERDKRRYDKALDVLRASNHSFTRFYYPSGFRLKKLKALSRLNLLVILSGLEINHVFCPRSSRKTATLKARPITELTTLSEIDNVFMIDSGTITLLDHDVYRS